jgi:YegS/Rv2252/BmrU family lipid kinase
MTGKDQNMVYFIVNPAAGNGKAKAAVPVIDRLMRYSGEAYSFVHTNKPGDIEWVASQIDYSAAKAIACVGGDGTVQEFVSLAVGRGVDFAVIPAGCGNDLIYSMPGGGQKFNSFDEKIEHYTRAIINGGTMLADIVAVHGSNGNGNNGNGNNGNGNNGDNGVIYFFNIGGAGIDTEVLKDAILLKKTFAGAAYFMSLIKNVATYKNKEMTLMVDGKAEKGKYLLLAVCNGAYFGGHLRIAPSAIINDGQITLCKITKVPRLKLMAVFPMVKSGRHIVFKEVSQTNCSSVIVEFQGKLVLNLDGNLCEFESPLFFELRKGAVRLVV